MSALHRVADEVLACVGPDALISDVAYVKLDNKLHAMRQDRRLFRELAALAVQFDQHGAHHLAMQLAHLALIGESSALQSTLEPLTDRTRITAPTNPSLTLAPPHRKRS